MVIAAKISLHFKRDEMSKKDLKESEGKKDPKGIRRIQKESEGIKRNQKEPKGIRKD